MLTLKSPSTLGREFESIQLIDLRSWLPVNPNYTWAQLAGIRPVESLNTIVCHHDAISKSKSIGYTDTELARRIAVDHINSKKNHPKGDAGFPYDVWIRNGIIYWCNDMETREYGVASNNGYTVNVCVSGEYAYTDQLTDADRKALYAAILLLKECLPNDKHLKGHKELAATACPGYDMIKVREDIMTIEQEIIQADSPSKKEELAYRMANQILYIQNMSKGKNSGLPVSEDQKAWALKQLLLLEPEFRRLGFLK